MLRNDTDPNLVKSQKRNSSLRWDDDKFERSVQIDTTTKQMTHKLYSPDEQTNEVKKEAEKLLAAASDPSTHITRLERVFNPYILCKFSIEDDDRDAILTSALSYLERMPSFTPELYDALESIPLPYFRSIVRSWTSLKVATFAHQNLIRLALDYAISKFYGRLTSTGTDMFFQSGLNTIGELLTQISLHMRPDAGDKAYTSWIIARCYLWTYWQRAKTLHNFSVIENGLCLSSNQSVQTSDMAHVAQANFWPSPHTTLRDMSLRHSKMQLSENVCNWTFELLRNQPLCYGLDFRLLNHRYASVLGKEPGRCGLESKGTCDGQSHRTCLRFYGATIENQSAHDSQCSNMSSSEVKFPWNESSYRSILGARAVALTSSDLPTTFV